jgi:hypothetical protein
MVEKYESVFMGRAKQHVLGILDSPANHEGHARQYEKKKNVVSHYADDRRF